jgi:hypothetical protein
MSRESRHISEWVDCPAQAAYDYASNPANVPEWAPGLGSSVEQVGGTWMIESPMGRVSVDFAPRNEFGVIDHTVTLPTGETVNNPMRVIPDGDACEVVFTLRRRDGVSDAEFEQDAAAVAADLRSLKQLLESRR